MSAFSRAATAPLYAWSAERLEGVCACIDAKLAAWAGAWGLDLQRESASCAQLGQQAAREPTLFLGRRGASAAWMVEHEALLRCVQLRLFGRAPASGTVAEEVAISCEEDLLDRLRAMLGITNGHASEDPPADAGRAWTGWVLAHLPLGARLLVSPQAVESILGQHAGHRPGGRGTQAPPLVPLGPALASSVLPLHAELEGCEVSIETLQSLRPGDVLRLKHALDAPALVRSGGHVLFSGFLARRGGRRALELASHSHGGEP